MIIILVLLLRTFFIVFEVIFFFKTKKSGVALTQLSLTLHYSRRVFYYQFYIHVKAFFPCFIVDELPAFIVIVYIFLT